DESLADSRLPCAGPQRATFVNHFVLIRQECAEAIAKQAPHMQAKNHTRAPPSSAWIGVTKAVVIRTTHASMPLTDASRYAFAMCRDRGSLRSTINAREQYTSR